MELNEYQLLYVQTVYNYFQENFQWPTYRQVQKKHFAEHPDFRAVDVAISIEDNPTKHFASNLEDRAAITLKEIHQLPQAQQDLDNLVKVIQYSVKRYIAEDTAGVTVTSEEISQNLHLDETAIRKIPPLLGLTVGMTQSSGISPDNKTWHFVLADSIIDYHNMTSIEDYFARREERIKSYQANQPAHNALLVNQFIDVPVVTVKPRISDEVVNAVADPKIKQICLELNNTPDKNVLSLAQSVGEALQWTLWYQAQKAGTSMTAKNMGLEKLLNEAINKPYYSGNAATRFLKDFKDNFMKTGYDMVRHDPAYIPNSVSAFGPAIDALEHVLKETFPI
ncbi:MAG TPA: hypothetical protein VFV38_10265 [Ktedonobacteraceae bacterium]|nr:hypothetical protein [Ktedonobacteraceae bacterium]